MKPAIEVQGLSKRYTINHKNKASYRTLKDDVTNLLRKPIKGFSKELSINESEEKFWALKDVGFEVPQGEIFGVVGQNGSGKSTLLKILSRIVQPTEGQVKLRGRTASLLEVGTGFHPELTGRENVYFNGSMLGMSRQEINRKFNEIVEFSEVEKFIDTPVKFYSSGMYVRLAFSVAAHLDPEILILDEVLAVGDAAFQKKSLSKILSTMREGRTVLFVSHSMSSIRQLCTRGIMLKHGHVAFSGTVDELIEQYTLENDKSISVQKGAIGTIWHNTNDKIDSDYFKPTEAYITDEAGIKVTDSLANNQDHWVTVEGIVKKYDPLMNIGYSIWDNEARNLLYLTFSTDGPEPKWPKLAEGKIKLRGKLPKHFLNAGFYKLKVIASIHGKTWIFEPDSSQIQLEVSVRHGKRESPIWTDGRGGLFAPVIEWTNAE